jgi:hemerythrin
MVLLKWNPGYSVGIDAIDFEHQQLIDTINELHEQLDRPDGRQTVPGFFGELLREISAHFALEEKIMRDMKYQQLKQHKENHEELLDEIRDIMDAFEQSEEIDSVELAMRLDKWFTHHFKTHDAHFHREIDRR